MILEKLHRNVTSCPKGHPYTTENSYIQPSTGWRLCRACKSETGRLYREKNIEDLKKYKEEWDEANGQQIAKLHRDYYDRIREIIESAKDIPCADCGVRYPHYVMDFDHVRGEKLMNVGRTRNIADTIEEIKKCDVVCANCHRERTWRNNGRQRNRSDKS